MKKIISGVALFLASLGLFAGHASAYDIILGRIGGYYTWCKYSENLTYNGDQCQAFQRKCQYIAPGTDAVLKRDGIAYQTSSGRFFSASTAWRVNNYTSDCVYE